MARPRKKNKHLPSCVYERHGAYWHVSRGKWTRLGSTLSESLAAYAGLVGEPSEGMPALIDRVLAHIKPQVKDNTYRQYCGAAKHLKARLAEFRPEEVKQKHVAAIKRDMVATPNMANRVLSLLRVVFRQAAEWQIVDTSPCADVRLYTEKKRGRYITDAEYQAIYRHAGPRLQVIMDLLYLTGQRVRDVLRIRRADLSEAGIQFEQQKTGARLVVAWTPELEAVVGRGKGLQGNVAALTLLHGRKGKAPDYRTVALQWREACEKAVVEDAQLRDLRAKSLTDAKRQGLDATALAGHSSPTMTDRYIRQREIPVVAGPSFGQLFDSAEKQP